MDTGLAYWRGTRRLTGMALGLLALQLMGNLYEEVVTNAGVLADPAGRRTVGEAEVGSPLFSYVPWVPIGIALVVVLWIRARREAPAAVARRLGMALGALAIAAVAKAALIVEVNPTLRDPAASEATVHEHAVVWAIGNGAAIVAVAVAVWLIVSSRAMLVDGALRARPVAA